MGEGSGGGEVARFCWGGGEGAGTGGGCDRPALGSASARLAPLPDLGAAGRARSRSSAPLRVPAGLRVGSPRPRSARRAAGPSRPPGKGGRSRAHGVFAPDTRSPVRGRETLGESPSGVGTGCGEAGRRLPSGSSLAAPHPPP